MRSFSSPLLLAAVAGFAGNIEAYVHYSCTSNLGSGNAYCAQAVNNLIFAQTGCDGSSWIPGSRIEKSVYNCKASLRGGRVIGDYTLGRMFMPLVNRCARGSFCDDASGICGTLESAPGPGKRADEDETVSARDSAAFTWTEDLDTLADTDLNLYANATAGSNDNIPDETETRAEHKRDIGFRRLVQRANGCQVPPQGVDIFRRDGQYRFQRITVLSQSSEERAPPSSVYSGLRDALRVQVGQRSGQNNGDGAESNYISSTTWVVAAAAPQGGSNGGGYQTWAAVSVYFSRGVLEDFVYRSVNDMATNRFIVGVYEIVDSGNNGVVRLVVWSGVGSSTAPTNP